MLSKQLNKSQFREKSRIGTKSGVLITVAVKSNTEVLAAAGDTTAARAQGEGDDGCRIAILVSNGRRRGLIPVLAETDFAD